MFNVDQNITDLQVKERNLFKVLFSMNIHGVATPEGSVEDARSYLFFCREGSGKIMSYIGLYFTRTDRRLFYSYSSNPFSESEIADVEAEARAFAEDMGAMLDEIDIAKMSMEEKRAWINGQDIFSAKKKVGEKPAVPQAAATPAASSSGPQQPAVAVPVPPVQPAPAVQPAAPPPPPVQTAPAMSPAAPLVQPQAQTPPPIPPPAPVQTPETPAPVQEAAHPKRRQVAPPAAAVPTIERTPTPPRGVPLDDVLDEAVKAGVVRAPKKQLSNDLRSATGKVSRDKEALARLLASF